MASEKPFYKPRGDIPLTFLRCLHERKTRAEGQMARGLPDTLPPFLGIRFSAPDSDEHRVSGHRKGLWRVPWLERRPRVEEGHIRYRAPEITSLGWPLPGPGSTASQVSLQRSLQSPPVPATGTFLFITDDRTVPFQAPVREPWLAHPQVRSSSQTTNQHTACFVAQVLLWKKCQLSSMGGEWVYTPA